MEKPLDVNELMRELNATLKGEPYIPQETIPSYATVTYDGGVCLPEEEDWYTTQLYCPESYYYYNSTYVPETSYDYEKEMSYQPEPGSELLTMLLREYVSSPTPSYVSYDYEKEMSYQPEPGSELLAMLLGETYVSSPTPSYVSYDYEKEMSYQPEPSSELLTTTPSEVTPPSVQKDEWDILMEKFEKGEANVLDLIKYFQKGGKPRKEEEEIPEYGTVTYGEGVCLPEEEEYYKSLQRKEEEEIPEYGTVTYGEGICLPEEEEYYKSLQRKEEKRKFNIMPLLFIGILFYFLYKKLKRK